MLLDLTHETRYDYSPEVEISRHLAHLRPPTCPSQTVLAHSLDVQPAALEPVERSDLFGNAVQQWALYAPHQQLSVTAHSRISTHEALSGHSTLSWPELAAHFEYRAGHPADDQGIFCFASRHVPICATLRDWALAGLDPEMTAQDAGIALMQRLHREFTYDSQSTHIGTPTLVAFEQRRGVCQDFAHILLGALRSIGLAARYVSGYLLTQPPPGQPKLVGSDASHAWVSLYLPDAAQGPSGGWYDLDPTNDRHGWASPGPDYIHLAWGRDYADVSPLRGVIQGGCSHTVTVGVTVTPSE